MKRRSFYYDQDEERYMPESEREYWDWRLDDASFMPATITKSQYLEANAMPVRPPTRTEVIHDTRPARVVRL